jgi:hypothetical protein
MQLRPDDTDKFPWLGGSELRPRGVHDQFNGVAARACRWEPCKLVAAPRQALRLAERSVPYDWVGAPWLRDHGCWYVVLPMYVTTNDVQE